MKDELQLRDPDGVYEALMDAHAGLGPEQSGIVNAALILLLANQVGDDATVLACIRAAQLSLDPEASR